MKTATDTLAAAMMILSRDIFCEDGVATAAIAEAGCRLLEQQDEIASLRSQPANMSKEWIPVTERLPEKGSPVIGWFPGATHPFECSLNEHDGVWCDLETGIYLYENERPTHWMKLPEPPEVK